MPISKALTKDEIEKIRDIPMVFIIGKGRSGTSLLQNLLDAHSGIIGGSESKFVVVFYPCFAHIKKWKESDIISFADKLYLDPLFTTFWNLDKKVLTETLLSTLDFASYSLLCKIVYYQLRRDKEQIIYISDKNPEYTLYLDTIEKIFPDAKFVHIVREPRDNIYSHSTSFREKNTKFRANQWLAYNTIVEEKKKREPGKFITVLYETLVSNTNETMKLICDFLGISFTEAMTQNKTPEWFNSGAETKGITDEGKIIHRNLFKPVNTSNVGKWKNKMDIYDQTLTEIITGDFAHKTYGYDIDSNRKNKPVKISSFFLFKAKCIYYLWQKFIRLKMKSFRFNYFYTKWRRKRNKNIPAWKSF